MHLILLIAALGGRAASVDADRIQMQGALLGIQAAQAFTLQEIRTAAGTTVREYVSPSGDVFAVTWNGPFVPDLRQLLGTYFDAYQRAAGEARRARRSRGPLVVDDGDFVLESAGHMRSFSGRAYVRTKMPSGTTAAAIRQAP